METLPNNDFEQRRIKLREESSLNGIDYLEIIPPPKTVYQPLILVFCFKPLILQNGMLPFDVKIEGGVRIKNIKVVHSQRADKSKEFLTFDELKVIEDIEEDEETNVESVFVVRPSSDGDFSTYTLKLVDFKNQKLQPLGFDRIFSKIPLNFKVDCPSEFDCLAQKNIPQERYEEPVIDYMAKDYASFRRLMLDRLSTLMPNWKEKNPADFVVALIELSAYVSDHLSYYQDAVATEQYLGTARKRVSVKRHARLLDYIVHEGCNSRAWVCMEVEVKNLKVPKGTPLITSRAEADPVVKKDEYEQACKGCEIFETMETVVVQKCRNSIKFFTWGEERSYLPIGATAATLSNEDNNLNLKVGDVLVFEELRSPESGLKSEADPLHRTAVRLTKVEMGFCDVYKIPIVYITWNPADSLPFRLELGETDNFELGEEENNQISVARGNVLLVDHGKTVCGELGSVPKKGAYYPRLPFKGLTYAGPYDPSLSAFSAFNYDIRNSLPEINLVSYNVENVVPPIFGAEEKWELKNDLLGSDKFSPHFVVEKDNDGTAYIRFGDNIHGKSPRNSTDKKKNKFSATYRIGNGRRGNVGSNTITRIVNSEKFSGDGIERIWNPIQASGGTDPEDVEKIRQYAPWAFRTQQRAVTEEDYAEILKRNPEVQKAMAAFRWTGSWYTIFVMIDRKGGKELDDNFKAEIRALLNKYRLAGYDYEIIETAHIPLDISAHVCVDQNYLPNEVKKTLLEVFSNRDFPDGKRGFFHPDNFTFGQPVYLSKLYETAMQVNGVTSVTFDIFKRWGKPDSNELRDGIIKTSSFEIVRLDNDPNFPENGKIRFIVEGGR